MSGQYPGHSRPPVGTPPPQTVWNHLTMTQGSGLNIHPTALTNAVLNPANFYSHSSMTRSSHLTSQLTPQLAHTQSTPTWHTPTAVPSSKTTSSSSTSSTVSSVTSGSTGSSTTNSSIVNPLFNLQALVDNNRTNQNQYHQHRVSPNTLDLSTTSSDIAENYSRITQDIPISLTARNIDKNNRNGNIISPPIPLNGETSSDSGISSSVPTPSEFVEPVSLSTKDTLLLTTPKITVKNFDSHLKGVANIHDKIGNSGGNSSSNSSVSVCGNNNSGNNSGNNSANSVNSIGINIDNFSQKVINLPSSVTIERILPDNNNKKDNESIKIKDSLSVIPQPRSVLPVIVNLKSRYDKDVIDSPICESSSSSSSSSSINDKEQKKNIDEMNVRSPKNIPKRGNKKCVDSLLEKLESGSKKLGSTENIGSILVIPVDDCKDASSIKSMSPDRQKSKSPTREDDVVSPEFSNDDSNDNTKQRRKRKLEKPVRLSKDAKNDIDEGDIESIVESKELREPKEPRISIPIIDELTNKFNIKTPIPTTTTTTLPPPLAPPLLAPPSVPPPPLTTTSSSSSLLLLPPVEENNKKETNDNVLPTTIDLNTVNKTNDGDKLKVPDDIISKKIQKEQHEKKNEKELEQDDNDEDEDEDDDDDDDEDDDDEDDDDDDEDDNDNDDNNEEELKRKKNKTEKLKQDENTNEKDNNEPSRRRRSSENTSTNPTPMSQRTRRKSSDDATDLSKVTSPSTVINNANPFNEVESELEKMFAGIVENDTDVKEENIKNDNIIEQVKTEVDVIKEEKSEVKLENNKINDTITETTTTTETSTTTTTTVPTTKSTPKKGKKGRAKGKKRKGGYKPPDNMFCMDDLPQKPTKKRKSNKSAKKQDNNKKKKKTTKIDGLKDTAYDSGSNTSSIKSRGPVVHVQGPRDSPLSIEVVNAPREDEEEKNKEKRKSLGNGNAGRSKRHSHQNDLDYRGKVSRTGLFSSTLSSRYDAHTTDSSWICVFCKQGPHSVIPGDPSRPHPNLIGPHIVPGTYVVPAGVLSDLFGPYLIGRERNDDASLSTDEQEVANEQKKGCKNKRSLRYAGIADQFTARMAKKKRNSIDTNAISMYSGMTLLTGDEQRWEVWLHEQCALWAAGVYLAGGRVSGLQEAVWDATQSICTTCGLAGANIGCVKRGCKEVTHYPCALTKGWLLDTNHYIPKCHIHRVT